MLLSIVVWLAGSLVGAADEAPWWDARWPMRTTVWRPTPWTDDDRHPVEVVIDFDQLYQTAGIAGGVDLAGVRVVRRGAAPGSPDIPLTWRQEYDPAAKRPRPYLVWFAQARHGESPAYDIYFRSDAGAASAGRDTAGTLPPENLLSNPSFEQWTADVPDGWKVQRVELIRPGRFGATTGNRSLAIIVDEKTSPRHGGELTVTQRIDVAQFAGQEMVFECDLLAERAVYGAPLSIELRQFRADGSAVSACAVDPRWLTIELAQGQLVQFRERGRFDVEAATVEVRLVARCSVRDEDTGQRVEGPESFFKIWVDRLVIRPGERWPYPAASHAGFVPGAMETAPVNRAFAFTGQRRLIFNGESEGALNAGARRCGPESVHWGLQSGTVEFWCRPGWNSDDGREHIFWDGVAYMHRRQSLFRKCDGSRKNQLEFFIADADGKGHTVRAPANLRARQWHHLAATWDFPRAHLQLFVDGQPMAAEGPGSCGWPSSLKPDQGSTSGIGSHENDHRSMPMQAFVGGNHEGQAASSAEATIDELRISDCPRYSTGFTPSRHEFTPDAHTRALFHFENRQDGIHYGDDRWIRGHLCVDLPPQEETVPLETIGCGKIARRLIRIAPLASDPQFAANRAENRLTVTRPFVELPDPRFLEYCPRQVERLVGDRSETFSIAVGGDFEPLMRSVSYELADPRSAAPVAVPHWRANRQPVPLSTESLRATVAPDAAADAERAFAAFRYALATTNYYDAGYCETLPSGHRTRVSYTLIKGLNIHPFDQCGPLNYTLRKLLLAAGISSNDAPGTHHQFEQAFYDGQWRLFDLSPRLYWLDRDNASVVGHRGLEDDPYLKILQGGDVCAWLPGRPGKARLGNAVRPHCMDFSLRPGERASLCWHNEGRWFELQGNREPLPLAKIPPMFGNGAILYTPCEGPATTLENLEIVALDRGGSSPLSGRTGAQAGKTSRGRSAGAVILRPRLPNRPATLTYRASSPYIFSDLQIRGAYRAERDGAIRLSLSFDEGKTWKEVWQSDGRGGPITANPRQEAMARYAYWLRLELAAHAGAAVEDFQVRSSLVASHLALPGRLSRGENQIAWAGPTPENRGDPAARGAIRTVCRFVERSRRKLGISLAGGLSFYTADDATHRNLFVVAPGGKMRIGVMLHGPHATGEARIELLPPGWTASPSRIAVNEKSSPSPAQFLLRPVAGSPGEIESGTLVVAQGGMEHRVPFQVLIAEAPLVQECERADQLTGAASIREVPIASGSLVVEFTGGGGLKLGVATPRPAVYALWLRARWAPESSTSFALRVDDQPSRALTPEAMIGFSDWTNPHKAYTKMFAHFGEQYGHWAWYRIADLHLDSGKHQLELSAERGASFDALVLLPQDPLIDRAAMNLFQNANFAPWHNPF